MTPFLLPFTRVPRPMWALKEVVTNEYSRLFWLGPAVNTFLFNDWTMCSLSTARHSRSTLHETTIKRPQNPWSLTDTAPKTATMHEISIKIHGLKALIWAVSDCLLMAAFRSVSHNLWRTVSSMGRDYLRQGSLPARRHCLTAPPSRPSMRARERSCGGTTGEGARRGKRVSGNSMRSPSSCPPLRR